MSRVKKNIHFEELEALEIKNELLEAKLEQHEKRLDNLERLVFSSQKNEIHQSETLVQLLANVLQNKKEENFLEKSSQKEEKESKEGKKEDKNKTLEFGRLRTVV